MSDAPAELRGYPVKRRTFHYVARSIELLGPANYESLLDKPEVVRRFSQDEYLPYWAEFWPANLLLTDAVAAWGAAPSPAPCVLEFGCGLGLTSLVAALLGYRVIASDYDEDALAFVHASAVYNQIPMPELRFIDWRQQYPDLRVDRIVAAEVLYEARSLQPIAEFIARHLAADGLALLVDRLRPTADAFPGAAARCGLRVTQREVSRPASPGERHVDGRIFHLTHA